MCSWIFLGLPGANSKEKAMNLLNKTGVASVPGEAFYHGGAGEYLARFCFAKEDTILNEACKRMRNLILGQGRAKLMKIATVTTHHKSENRS